MKRIKAFTILEVIVVLAIASLVLGLSTVYFFNFKSASALRLEANEIVAVLNQARSLAITKLDNHKVLFDKDDNKYVLRDSFDNDLEPERLLKNGIVIDSITGFLDGNTVEFKSTGGLASGGGSIVLKNNKDKLITITIINTTGRIRLADS